MIAWLISIGTARRVVRAAILLLVACAVAFSIDQHDATAQPAALLPEPQTAAWWMARHDATVAALRGNAVDLLFIGDSITQGWEDAGREVWTHHYGSRRAFNLGYNSDRTEHVLWRLQHGELDDIAPRAIVLLIGTNNTSAERESPEDTAAGVRAIVELLRHRLPTSQVLVLGLFPRGLDANDRGRQVNTQVNRHLQQIADHRTVWYLDLGELFYDEVGRLSTVAMPDLLHPSAEGYRRWAEAMEPMIMRLLQKP